MTNAWYKQFILPQARTYHIKADVGWERNSNLQWEKFQQENSEIFKRRMEELCPHISEKLKEVWK